MTAAAAPYERRHMRINLRKHSQGLELQLPYLSWLADDYVQLSDIEHAADIAVRMAALAARTNSTRTDTRLRYIAKQLTPYKATPSVTDFFDVYQSVADVPLPRQSE